MLVVNPFITQGYERIFLWPINHLALNVEREINYNALT